MSRQLSPDARAVVRAIDALTTQVRRIADRMPTGVTDADDGAATACPTPLTHNWGCGCPTDLVPADSPRCVCGDPIELTGDPASWIHSPGSDTPCLDAHTVRLPDGIPDVRPASAADEDAVRTARRQSLHNLLARLERSLYGPIAHEVALLRQHVEAEIREANTAREVARGNLRHVQVLVPELELAQAAIERVRTLVAGRWGLVDPDHVRAALDNVNGDEVVTAVNPVTTGSMQPASSPLREHLATTLAEFADVDPYAMADAILHNVLSLTGITAALARMSQAADQRLIAATEQAPPSGTVVAGEWESGWDAAMDAVRAALTSPAHPSGSPS
ncbi:hypothetical protein AB0H51_11510 [Streptomyces griseoluteus]|uniref:hypothetical protein n=1 Tax=Streptomyces griseoluteus TaxID=29306 RepID=UPI0033D24DEF